jgi:hypothetical protein
MKKIKVIVGFLGFVSFTIFAQAETVMVPGGVSRDGVEVQQFSSDETVNAIQENALLDIENNELPTTAGIIPGMWNYYTTKGFNWIPGNNNFNVVRMAVQITPTDIFIDLTWDGNPEETLSGLSEGDCVERNVLTLPGRAAHIWATNPITVHQYDDFPADWEMTHIPPYRHWGNEYWYGGIRSHFGGFDHLLITSANTGTNVQVDFNSDGIPEFTNILADYDIWDLTQLAGEVDPRTGARITSDQPIQVHAFAEMLALFGSSYNVLPTEALGQEYLVPKMISTFPGEDDSTDRIVVVSTIPGTTFVNIDTDLDSNPDANFILIGQSDWAAYPLSNQVASWVNGTFVSADQKIGCYYLSSTGGQHWDGFASQLVSREAACPAYWNTVDWQTYSDPLPLDQSSFNLPGEPRLFIFAFEDATTVNVDQDNDGTPDKSFTLDFMDGGVIYVPQKCGEKIYSSDPDNKPIVVYQDWYKDAGDVLTPVSWCVPTAVGIEEEGLIPKRNSIALYQNTPNPFYKLTAISYQIPSSNSASSITHPVSLSIYDITGRLVETLVDEQQEKGIYQVKWDGGNVASGIYFYRLNVDGIQYDSKDSITKKMILLK